eukprot:684849-Hanusia_phi.AAC.4
MESEKFSLDQQQYSFIAPLQNLLRFDAGRGEDAGGIADEDGEQQTHRGKHTTSCVARRSRSQEGPRDLEANGGRAGHEKK